MASWVAWFKVGGGVDESGTEELVGDRLWGNWPP
jgi:hypothetical protein